MALAGLMFAAGGFSGMINAGMNINYLIHNTIWVPGHFHMTVGTAVALTMMAGSYWLLPQITGKKLQLRGLASLQPYVWFVGMAVMSNAMHRAGLAGIPRRTAEPTYDEFAFEGVAGTVGEMRLQIAIGGFLLFVGAAMFLIVWPTPCSLAVGECQVDRLTAVRRPTTHRRVARAVIALRTRIAYGPPLASMVLTDQSHPVARQSQSNTTSQPLICSKTSTVWCRTRRLLIIVATEPGDLTAVGTFGSTDGASPDGRHWG